MACHQRHERDVRVFGVGERAADFSARQGANGRPFSGVRPLAAGAAGAGERVVTGHQALYLQRVGGRPQRVSAQAPIHGWMTRCPGASVARCNRTVSSDESFSDDCAYASEIWNSPAVGRSVQTPWLGENHRSIMLCSCRVGTISRLRDIGWLGQAILQ